MSSLQGNAGKGLPSKKSVFEQKKEADAKKARDEAAATAAALAEFEQSFEDQAPTANTFSRGGFGGGSAPGPGRRHFTPSTLKSGPGSLGPSGPAPKSGPGSIGPTPTSNRKRPFDDFSGRRDRDRRSGQVSRNDYERGRADAHDDHRRDEKEEAARPTLHLTNLPPGTSPAVIKALFMSTPLSVENVSIKPDGNAHRKALTALLTLDSETAATDIDATVSSLQNKYLGFGFNLSISRHLSSATLTSIGTAAGPGTLQNALPFGAKTVNQHTSLSRAPPPGQAGRFAPPTSYTSSTPYGNRSKSQVSVQTPSELGQLRLIHKALEALLTYGSEFEALLMSCPDVQRDEKWAWLFDASSVGGVYYRWRLWEVLTDAANRKRTRALPNAQRSGGETLFEGEAYWSGPQNSLKFEHTTTIEDFVSDEDYNSSEEEEEGGEGGLAERYRDHQTNDPGATTDLNDSAGYLNPIAKTKLVHLLSRLPRSNAMLRRGDVARITGFAIEHAGVGAREVASIITRNVVSPFRANQPQSQDNSGDDTAKKAEDLTDVKDTSAASLVALYIISDILSSSASAGVRHAWRYRVLFEDELRRQSVFERLGRIEKDLSWGKLKAEKWKRSIQTLLSLWEGWSVFPHDKHEAFLQVFLNPPLSAAEQALVDAEAKRKSNETAQKMKGGTKWRSVTEDNKDDVDPPDVNMQDVDGTAMEDDDDDMAIDSGSLLGGNIDGVPMDDSSDEEMRQPDEGDPQPEPPAVDDDAPPPGIASQAKAETTPAKRQRAKAVDMFGDSD